MLSRTSAKAMLNPKILHWRVVRSARKGDFDDITRVLLDALDQAEQMNNSLRRFSYLSELNEKYHFFLMHPEIKFKYGQLLKDASPTLEDLEKYEGYEL